MRTALLVLAGADLRAVLPEAGHVSTSSSRRPSTTPSAPFCRRHAARAGTEPPARASADYAKNRFAFSTSISSICSSVTPRSRSTGSTSRSMCR